MDPDLLVIFGSIIAIVIGTQLIGLAKKWISRNNVSYDDEKFNRLAKAFISHKKDMERRIQNLEALISEDEPKSVSSASSRPKGETKNQQQIEIESNEDSEKERNQSDGGNLRNMLKE